MEISHKAEGAPISAPLSSLHKKKPVLNRLFFD